MITQLPVFLLTAANVFLVTHRTRLMSSRFGQLKNINCKNKLVSAVQTLTLKTANF